MGSIYKTKSLPRRGYRTQPRVSTLGNFNLAVRPHKALLYCALGKNTRRARVGGAEGASPDLLTRIVRHRRAGRGRPAFRC